MSHDKSMIICVKDIIHFIFCTLREMCWTFFDPQPRACGCANATPYLYVEGQCLARTTGLDTTFISLPNRDFNHHEALNHKQMVTCAGHYSLGIVSEIRCEILHMGSVTGRRSWPAEGSLNYSWCNENAAQNDDCCQAWALILWSLISLELFYDLFHISVEKLDVSLGKSVKFWPGWGTKAISGSLLLWHQAVMSGQIKWRQGQHVHKAQFHPSSLATWQNPD